MVYETAANIRILLGLDVANWTDAKLTAMQNQADYLIESYNAKPETGIAKQIETEVVFRLITRSQFLHNYRGNGLDLANDQVFRPILLTKEQKRLLTKVGPRLHRTYTDVRFGY